MRLLFDGLSFDMMIVTTVTACILFKPSCEVAVLAQMKAA